MAIAITTSSEPPKLAVGWVLGGTFSVLWRRSVDLLILGALFVLLPYELRALLPPEYAVAGLLAGLPALVFVGSVSLITHQELSAGERVGIGEAISEGAGSFASLWGAAILLNIATAIGLLLLIVPGVIILSGCMSASAVIVVEDKTAFEALDRSWELSKGSRWRLAGVIGLAALVIAGLALLFICLLVGLNLIAGESGDDTIARFVVVPIAVFVLQAFTTALCAAVYTGLRIAKESGAGDVSAVFA